MCGEYGFCAPGAYRYDRYTKALDNIKTLRKDRVADLKVEKERLEGLAREKRHADKLRSNAADLTANIASKQVELDETQRKHAEITLSNKRFLDQATHFREIYIRAESAAKNKDKLEDDLKEALSTIKEVDGKSYILLHYMPSHKVSRDGRAAAEPHHEL